MNIESDGNIKKRKKRKKREESKNEIYTLWFGVGSVVQKNVTDFFAFAEFALTILWGLRYPTLQNYVHACKPTCARAISPCKQTPCTCACMVVMHVHEYLFLRNWHAYARSQVALPQVHARMHTNSSYGRAESAFNFLRQWHKFWQLLFVIEKARVCAELACNDTSYAPPFRITVWFFAIALWVKRPLGMHMRGGGDVLHSSNSQ